VDQGLIYQTLGDTFWVLKLAADAFLFPVQRQRGFEVGVALQDEGLSTEAGLQAAKVTELAAYLFLLFKQSHCRVALATASE